MGLSLNHSFIPQTCIVHLPCAQHCPPARDPEVNKSCSLECEGRCPDLGPSSPAPCSWQQTPVFNPACREGSHFRPIFGADRYTCPPPAIVRPAPMTWGRHRINYRPIIFMHKTWHRRLPRLQLPSGRLGAQERQGKESYKINKVNGSLRYKKKRRRFCFLFNFYTPGLDFLYCWEPLFTCHEKVLDPLWDHGVTFPIALDQKQTMEGQDPEEAAQP